MALHVLPLALGLLAGGQTAVHAGDPAADPVERGRHLAERHCAACHAVAGPGPGPVADAPAFATLERRWPLEFLAEAFAEGILVQHPTVRMPEFVFDPGEIDALLAYLQSIQE